jgi:hypothetical protein
VWVASRKRRSSEVRGFARSIARPTLQPTFQFYGATRAKHYVIGHLQAIAREYWLQSNSAGWLTKVFLAFVTLLFPDLQLFNLVDDIVAGTAIPLALFVKTATLGFFYTGFYLLLAWIVFYRREL